MTNKLTKLLLLLLLCTISVVSQAQSDALTVLWGDASGWTNVDNLATPNQAEMIPSSGNVQMQITAGFSGQGETKDRQITVNVPRGYRIVAYTAKSGTAAISGVQQIGLSPTDEANVTSNNLTATDGSPFANQVITGYSTTYSPAGANINYRVYDGKVVYTFGSNCDRIVLTLTLSVDQQIIPHTDPANMSGSLTKYTLPDITVEMLSGINTLSNHVRVLFSGLGVLRIGGASSIVYGNGHSGLAEGVVDTGDPGKGTCDFNTGWSFYSQVNIIPFADNIVITVPYPTGVTYKGFKIFGPFDTNQNTNPASGTYLNGHLTINNDVANRKMTFTFSKVNWVDRVSNTGLEIFWTAEVDNVNIKWDQQLNFPATATFTSGALVGGTQYTYTQSPVTTWRTPTKPEVKLNFTAANYTLRDLNVDGDFHYDWFIGQFNIQNLGPSVAQNLKYEFTFPASPQVRGVRIPCVAGTTDENVTVTGLTSTGRTLNYTFDLGNETYNGHTLFSNSATGITSEMLELTGNEYLVNLTVVQQTLQVSLYRSDLTSSSISYYGKFINGQEGNVTLELSADTPAGVASNLPLTATDHTKIGWVNSGMGTMSLVATHKGYPAMSNSALPSGDSQGGTFYPGDPVYFEVIYGNGEFWKNSNEVIDPVFYINLPKGIAIDPASVQVLSAAGYNGAVFVPASITGTPQTKTIGGVEWTSYRVEINNKYDIIARGYNNMDYIATATGLHTNYADQRKFALRFTAYVGSSSDSYPVIATKDIVNIDLGRSAVNALSGNSHAISDVNNWTGKGTTYYIGAAISGTNLSVVQKPGLNVYQGIRVAGTTSDYFTYNGTDASVASVSRDTPAEVWLKYENTSTDPYYAGSEIYLPIPKKNIAYNHYFNNSLVQDPAGVEDAGTANKAPQWTAELMEEVTLTDYFTTSYGVDAKTATNWTGGAITTGWTPITMQWYTYAELTAASYTLADVTMLKFTASQNIPAAGQAGSSGETSFRLAVAQDASLGQLDYWRSYQKGWREPDGSGSWVYGSVIAATPAMSGVEGKFFRDTDRDGILDPGEEYSTASPVPAGYAVSLSGTGITGSLPMAVDAPGNFRSLNGDGQIYYLRQGSYTVTVTNSDPASWHITDITPSTRSYFDASNNPVWFSDIPQGLIRDDNTHATFTFSVGALSTATQLVGVGIKVLQRYIPVNPHVSKGAAGR